ncbi:DUF4082 domain-containing protein [Micromonospora sp. WMMD1102]|uniref:DUF4082 domain-containing protein n=1 Tax=Micromonospora sp. WMMD1102 TaxID=3016105 RepID=UPI0024150EEE|nr:DUF4082 domain-containing protein [Micromonospora sp. WMMD1102]MDG4784354.1 DUF4082 domain-containing protein [Micromonospora sp. WMMD1102]MDG4784427.1 DUF4082 domain-containing protein [Micromonospora sp. WMMD1102]
MATPAASIFGDQVPVVTSAVDVTAFTLGTKWSASVRGAITHGRWYFPDVAPDGPTAWVLYDEVTEAEIARAEFTDTAPGWRTVALDPPVVYSTPGTVMVAAVEAVTRYVATAGLFADGPVISGPLTAPGDGDNGRVGIGAGYPPSTFGDTCYFADLLFAPSLSAGPRITTGTPPGRITSSTPGRWR